MTMQPTLIDGNWTANPATESFQSVSPNSGETLHTYPFSNWADVSNAIDAGVEAFERIRQLGFDRCAEFLSAFADSIEADAGPLSVLAREETGLDVDPRLLRVEIPRTVDQLRQAARAASSRSWRRSVISPASGIASFLAPIPGPVVTMGPNNFPFAFNSVSGGDAAAAIATGHPVIAKANPGHPGTTRRLAELSLGAAETVGMPRSTIQMLYRLDHADGGRLVGDARVAATAYTGSRRAGLALKDAADRAGNPIYLEMSSVNPVVVLPDAAADHEDLADALATSMLLGGGQFCTSPGLIFVLDEPDSAVFVKHLAREIGNRPCSTLLSENVVAGLESALEQWKSAGAEAIATGDPGNGMTFPNTLLKVSGTQFADDPDQFQSEAFGNLAIVVVCDDAESLLTCLSRLEGNLTGTIFGRGKPESDLGYPVVADLLRPRVGRLLFNKPPTGVAVADGMNHGGPYPSSGHPGFTAVGIPDSLERFCMLQTFDNIPDDLLPEELQERNPLDLQRRVNGVWTVDSFKWE